MFICFTHSFVSDKIGLRIFNVRTFMMSLRVTGCQAHVVLFVEKENQKLSELAEDVNFSQIFFFGVSGI